ncbi:MAG TPA: transporter substrate-binding domain-containing protein [Holophaga sp.]|nr:transporter substrate-binding domain-containing protein [Holophaga sp.]
MRVKRLAFLLTFMAAGTLFAQDLTLYCEEEPPNQYLGADGELTGMTVEVVREIMRRVGTRAPIQMVPWARAYDAALGQPDIVLFTVSRNAERNQMFNWVGPVHELDFTFYARADSRLQVKSLEDAKKLTRVGVYIDDVREEMLKRDGFTNLDRAANNIQNFRKLIAGRIDVYATSQESVEAEAASAGFSAAAVKPVYTFARVQDYIVLSKGTPAPVVKAWTKAFAGMKKDGTFAEIHRKYYPGRPLPGKTVTEF